MRNTIAVIVTALFLLAPMSNLEAQGYYKWTDKRGVVHFTDSLENVPARYRPKEKPTGLSKPQPIPKPSKKKTSPKLGETASGTKKLKRFGVPYKSPKGSAKRIIIPVTINGRTRARMLLDTGSPGMILNASLAVKAGLFKQGQGKLLSQASGIGGSTLAVRTIVDKVSVGQAHDTMVPATIVSRLSKDFDGIVGMDFISNYTLSIHSKKKVLVFQELPPEGDAPGGREEEWWRAIFQEFREALEQWKQTVRVLEDQKRYHNQRNDQQNKRLAKLKRFAEYQQREAQRILERLEHHASKLMVPRSWR